MRRVTLVDRRGRVGGVVAILVTAVGLNVASTADAQTAPPSDSPLAIQVGPAEVAIGGFIDATMVHRDTATGSGLGTSFGTIPFDDAVQGHLSETLLSAQNSRLTLSAAAPLGDSRVKGYLEADFLGGAPPGLNVTSNSNTLRMRVYWLQYRRNRVEFVAGQAWSLLTPSRNGLSPDTADVFFTQDVDPNYQAGLTWGRTMQFRFTAHPSESVAAAVSIENPDQYVGSSVVLPKNFPVGEVDTGSLSIDVPDPLPDVVAKVAFDPRAGPTHQHVDAGFVVRNFRTYDPATGQTHHAVAGGVQATVALEPVPAVRLVGAAFFSAGGGRYLAQTNIPDFVVNADASLTLVNSSSVLTGAEWRAAAPTQLWAYFSGVRTEREVSADVDGSPIGFGVAGSRAANERISDATVGVTHTFFRDPQAGGMQLMVQYSHVQRTPFPAPAGTPGDASANILYVNVRYTLP